MTININIQISPQTEKTNINNIDDDYYSTSNISSTEDDVTLIDDGPPPHIAKYNIDDLIV